MSQMGHNQSACCYKTQSGDRQVDAQGQKIGHMPELLAMEEMPYNDLVLPLMYADRRPGTFPVRHNQYRYQITLMVPLSGADWFQWPRRVSRSLSSGVMFSLSTL